MIIWALHRCGKVHLTRWFHCKAWKYVSSDCQCQFCKCKLWLGRIFQKYEKKSLVTDLDHLFHGLAPAAALGRNIWRGVLVQFSASWRKIGPIEAGCPKTGRVISWLWEIGQIVAEWKRGRERGATCWRSWNFQQYIFTFTACGTPICRPQMPIEI